VVREDPAVIDAWFMLGTQHMNHNQPDKAVQYFKKTLELKPDYDLAVFNLAQAYRRMGDDNAALAGFEHYLTLDPKDPFVHYQMGEIWLDRGDTARAEGLFRHALELDPQIAAAKNALGVMALHAGIRKRRTAGPRGDRGRNRTSGWRTSICTAPQSRRCSTG
jgi:Tfp pilus assembly protein PilF